MGYPAGCRLLNRCSACAATSTSLSLLTPHLADFVVVVVHHGLQLVVHCVLEHCCGLMRALTGTDLEARGGVKGSVSRDRDQAVGTPTQQHAQQQGV